MGEKCLQLPRAFSSESRFLRRMEEERGGVMVMQQLMEISCRDSVLVCEAGGPGGADHGRCGDTKALAPVLPNKQDNN